MHHKRSHSHVPEQKTRSAIKGQLRSIKPISRLEIAKAPFQPRWPTDQPFGTLNEDHGTQHATQSGRIAQPGSGSARHTASSATEPRVIAPSWARDLVDYNECRCFRAVKAVQKKLIHTTTAPEKEYHVLHKSFLGQTCNYTSVWQSSLHGIWPHPSLPGVPSVWARRVNTPCQVLPGGSAICTATETHSERRQKRLGH